MDDDTDFLDAVEADNNDKPVVEKPVLELTPEQEVPQPTPEVAPETVAAPAVTDPEAPVAPADPAKPEPGFVPINVMLDERDKRKKLEAQLAQFREQQAQPQQKAPDRWEDPEGHDAFQQQKIQQALYEQNLRFSERLAVSEHGAETVQKAKDWGIAKCNEDPYFNAKVAASPDPIAYAVAEWQREQIASQVTPADLTQFQAWKAAQAQIQAATPPAPQTAPPRSLAGAPSAGGVMTQVEQSDEEVFGEIFQRK